MKTLPHPSKCRWAKPGFASYLLVLSTGVLLMMLMLFTYKKALDSHGTQKVVQLRTDYGEREDAILRALVATVPNRAIRAMQNNSNANTANSEPLRWENILKDVLVIANARTAIPSDLMPYVSIVSSSTVDPDKMDIKKFGDMGSTVVVRTGNTGNSASTLDRSKLAQVFKVLPPDTASTSDKFYVSAGSRLSTSTLGTGYETSRPGFPPMLSVTNSTTRDRDREYPIITKKKIYGSFAAGKVQLPVADYPNFNLIPYPQINFGYAKPGELFVAKRNWWAFTLDAAAQEFDSSKLGRSTRDFVLSIYEVPSQLAISAGSFMSLGKFQSGEAWNEANVDIQGGVFVGKAVVEGETELDGLASRRNMSLSSDAVIGGSANPLADEYKSNPFQAGTRETYRLSEGAFFPVSLASESGRVAFIPISRGAEFFDRFHEKNNITESQTVSPTTWNSYSVGAMQCAMQVDVTKVISTTNPTPTEIRFSYLDKNGARKTYNEPLIPGISATLPPGYKKVCNENQSYDFGTQVVDVAYGINGKFYFETDVTGVVTFNNTRFGDPIVGTVKAGYSRPSSPYRIYKGAVDEVQEFPINPIRLVVYPQRFKAFLTRLEDAAGPEVNNSVVVNVDHTTIGVPRPMASGRCADSDYGLVLQECQDLTSFPKGFSLVTNLRTYIGEDFNTAQYTSAPPTGYTPPTGKYFPPASLFAPEKRFGVSLNPLGVEIGGQIGSLGSETADEAVSPLESKTGNGASLEADSIKVNLRPITHPVELPPIYMMNWLVVLEERRKEFVGN